MKSFELKRLNIKGLLLLISLIFVQYALCIEDKIEPISANFDKIFKNGDLIFIQSTSSQSKAISEVTKSIWTHVGILNKNENGEWEVIEAVSTVKTTPVISFISTQRSVPGKNFKSPQHGRFVVKRLKPGQVDRNKKLINLEDSKDWAKLFQAVVSLEEDITLNNPSSLSKTLKVEYDKKVKGTPAQTAKSGLVSKQKYLGKKYDIYFEWSNDVIYCSELTYKTYFDAFGIELGKIQTWGELKSGGHLDGAYAKSLVEARLTRNGKQFNHDEKILTPESQFQSEILFTAYDSDWYY